MRRILLIIQRPAGERTPMKTGNSAVLSRKGLQNSMPLIISLLRGETVVLESNKEIFMEFLPYAKSFAKSFHRLLDRVRYHGPHFTGRETEDWDNCMNC